MALFCGSNYIKILDIDLIDFTGMYSSTPSPAMEFLFLFVTYTIIQNITSSEICALHLTHPSAHTHRAVGSQCCGCPGSSRGFGALFKGLTSVVVMKVERLLFIHSTHRQFLPEPRFEPTTLGYKSDTLSIRPQLPPYITVYSRIYILLLVMTI